MAKKKYQLEVCANSVASALAAQEGGADRVELCQALELGGITPSLGQIWLTRAALRIGVHVLIRPRAGDFLYSDIEFEEMKADIMFCHEAECDGIVIGLLHPDGSVDVKRTTELVELAKPMHVTFHRAFDVCGDPFKALEDIIICGCGRLLTSGMENTALAGAVLIRQLVEQSAGRIEVMPGSGINEHNIAQLAEATGAKAFHASAKMTRISGMEDYTTRTIEGMGDSVWVSSKQKIHRLVDLLKTF